MVIQFIIIKCFWMTSLHANLGHSSLHPSSEEKLATINSQNTIENIPEPREHIQGVSGTVHFDLIPLPGLAQHHSEGPFFLQFLQWEKENPRLTFSFPHMGCFSGGLTTKNEKEIKKGVWVYTKQCLEFILHFFLQRCLNRNPSKQFISKAKPEPPSGCRAQ